MIWDEMILHYWKVGFEMLGNIYVVFEYWELLRFGFCLLGFIYKLLLATSYWQISGRNTFRSSTLPSAICS